MQLTGPANSQEWVYQQLLHSSLLLSFRSQPLWDLCIFQTRWKQPSLFVFVGLTMLKWKRKRCIRPTAMLHRRLTWLFAWKFKFACIVQPPASVFYAWFPHQLNPSACLSARYIVPALAFSQLPKHVGLGLHFSVSQATSRNLVIAIFHIFSSALFFYLSEISTPQLVAVGYY